VIEPTVSQTRANVELAADTRAASDSAVYETSTATAIERATSHEL
jgi:hypothetical protein